MTSSNRIRHLKRVAPWIALGVFAAVRLPLLVREDFWYDEVFTWTSLAVVAFVLYATAAARPGRDTRSTTKT